MIALCGVFVASQALAQGGDEPSKPGAKKKASDEPSKPAAKKSDEPSKPSTGTGAKAPATKASDEPGGAAKTGDEPGGGKAADEPNKGAGAGEPAKPGALTAPPVVKKAAKVSYGIGVHLRAIFLHRWFLNAFLKESTELNSVAFGGEFIRRKGTFDLIAAIDFMFYSPPDGNFLGRGKNAVNDTDYVSFRNLNILAFSVHFIWHTKFTEWLSLVYGAGVGLGIVLGGLDRISNGGGTRGACTPENAGNEKACFPKDQDPNSPETWPRGQGSGSPQNPHFFDEDDVWPVVPIVHLLVGLNFKISEQFSVRVDGGFRNAFYVGATGHYFF